jgi:hypothetical protein
LKLGGDEYGPLLCPVNGLGRLVGFGKRAIAFSEGQFDLRCVLNIEVLTIPLVENWLKVGGDESGPLLCPVDGLGRLVNFGKRLLLYRQLDLRSERQRISSVQSSFLMRKSLTNLLRVEIEPRLNCYIPQPTVTMPMTLKSKN